MTPSAERLVSNQIDRSCSLRARLASFPNPTASYRSSGHGSRRCAVAKTPVDLQRYASWQQEEPQEQSVGGGRRTVSRRPPIELPLPEPVETNHIAEASLDLESAAEVDDYDVPAFLRQQPE